MDSGFGKKIKYLLLIKVIFIAIVFASMQGKLIFGDKNLLAEDEKLAETFVDPHQKKTKKTSILEELFNLPKLDGEKLKKDEIGKYFSILDRKKQQIEARLGHLQKREAHLLNIEKSIDGKLQMLDNERRLFADSIQQEKGHNKERLKQLVAFYKKMTPKKAAPVFENLNKDLVVELFNQLPQKQIMNILSLMPSEKSVELTEYYGRIRSGREYDMIREMNSKLREEFEKCKS